MSEQVQRRAESGQLTSSTEEQPREAETVQARRRAALAMAAMHGAGDQDLVLGSDAEGLALLGVSEESPLMADVLRWQGSVMRDRGRTADAEALYKRSLEVAQKFNYLAGQSHAVNCLGAIAQRRGDLARANQLFQAALRMAEGCGEVALAGLIQQNRGVIADISGNSEAALRHYTDCLQTFETAKDTRSMTLVLNNLGLLQARMGRYDDARASYDRALSLARNRGDLLSEGVIVENAADLEMERGDYSAAGEAIARVLEIAALRKDTLRRASGLKLLGQSLRLGGHAQDSLEPLKNAHALCKDAEDAFLSGEILYETGLAHAECGDTRAARNAWLMALQAFERIGASACIQRVQQKLDG